MRWSLKLILLVCFVGICDFVSAGDHFRVKARLLTGAPARGDYRHDDVVSRGTFMAMLEQEELVENLNLIRRTQNPSLDAKTSTKVFRKIFRSAARDVATTAEIRTVEAAPVQINDIRLAAYSDGRVSFTGKIQCLPSASATDTLVKQRTDGCNVTIFVRGFGSTEVASTAVSPNGPMLFECRQSFWVSKGDNCAISLVCPADVRICGSAYQELTHLEIEVETRRNR